MFSKIKKYFAYRKKLKIIKKQILKEVRMDNALRNKFAMSREEIEKWINEGGDLK